MKHLRKVIRESLRRQLSESVTISPDERVYDDLRPDMENLLDLAHIVKYAVSALYHKYEFFQDLMKETGYKIYNIDMFGQGYDNRFNFDDPIGPVHDQDFDLLPEDAQEWVKKAVKKRLNDLGLGYQIIPASQIEAQEKGIVYYITENPHAGKSRPQINLSNFNYNYIFSEVFGLTGSYGGTMTANEVKDIALQLIAAGETFARNDKVCMVIGKKKVCASSEEDAQYLNSVGKSLLEFAEQCIEQNFNQLSAG